MEGKDGLGTDFFFFFFPSQQQSKVDIVHNTMAITKEQDKETSKVKK